MRRERKAALTIGGIVILAAAAGVALFLFEGSMFGVGFIVIGIPTLLVIGVGLYVRNVVSRTGTSQSSYTRQQAAETATRLRDFWMEFESLQKQFSDWNASEVRSDVNQIIETLEEQGVNFDRADGSYSLQRFNSADIQDLERVRDSIDDLDGVAAESYESFSRSELHTLRNAVDRLVDEQLATIDSWEGEDSIDDAAGDLDALVGVIEQHQESVRRCVRQGYGNVEAMLSDVDEPVDQQRVRSTLEAVEDDLDRDNYVAAVNTVIDAQQTLEGELSGRFETDRESVDALIDTVQSSVVDDYVNPRHVENIRQIDEATATLSSGLDVDELRGYQDDLRETCTAMVEEMSGDLDADLTSLSEQDLPSDYYEWPDAGDSDYVAELRKADSLDDYRLRWMSAVGELSTALDNVSTKASVARSYDDVAEIIEETLRIDGSATEDDLPVKRAGAFMELYADQNSGVSYDAAGPALVTEGEGEQHAVTVFTQFENGGPKRELVVEIEGPAYTDTERRETHLAEEVTFDGVPYGEYTIRAEPHADGYRSPERALTVDGDSRIELTMAEVGFRERVCEGRESEIREYIPELGSELKEQYDDEGYLSSDMSFPIKEEYVPCLLALWAEEEGLSVASSETGVVTYDGDQLKREIEMVINHNLSDGETMTFDDLRSGFLSAPLPDDVVQETVSDSPNADSVELSSTGITKVQ